MMPSHYGRDFVITVAGDFKPGDQAPTGYLDWHEWAEVQHKAGLRQRECGKCCRWKYPQELSEEEVRYEAKTRRGARTISAPICNECLFTPQENAGRE